MIKPTDSTTPKLTTIDRFSLPDSRGRFGPYGGSYVPETLSHPLSELNQAYLAVKKDSSFRDELNFLLRTFAGRPTELYYAERLSKEIGGAKIYLKREDLLHTGAHKINNALGQALLAKRMGKTRIIAETGAGQHGIATASVCAHFGFKCVIYMGAEDMRRQALNVFRMRLSGAEVRGVESGSKTLKEAINEAMRDWVTNVHDTHYILGSALGAHPYPGMVKPEEDLFRKATMPHDLKGENWASYRDVKPGFYRIKTGKLIKPTRYPPVLIMLQSDQNMPFTVIVTGYTMHMQMTTMR